MADQDIYNISIDYSNIQGNKVLPYVLTLNEAESNLSPLPGEYQRFCYEITGVGENKSQYSDLNNFIIGISDEITKEQFISAAVIIDGKPQQLVWGDNIQLKTSERPDPITGGSGLKLNFPLKKVNSEMKVIFELDQAYEVGPSNVYLYGGDVSVSGLAICGPCSHSKDACRTEIEQKETVCVPVKIQPYAIPGKASVKCCGDPIVTYEDSCTCSSSSSVACELIITQRLKVKIPIAYGAKVTTGEVFVHCEDEYENHCECEEVYGGISTTIESAKNKNSFFKNK